jgi:hypothetical protein
MDISKIYSSGILNKGEEITSCFPGKYFTNDKIKGLILFTNRRFIFLRKPGHFAKGYNVVFFSSWGDIVSVSTVGLLRKKLNLSLEKENGVVMYKLSCDNVESVAQKIIHEKANYVEASIIEEAHKDKPMVILQKRLARGEISLEDYQERILEAHRKLKAAYDDSAKRHATLENRLARIKELYEWGHKPKDEYLAEYDAIQRELRALAAPDDKRKTLDKLAHFLSNVVDAWKEAAQEQRNKLASALFEQVWIEHNRVVGIKPREELKPFFQLSYEEYLKSSMCQLKSPRGRIQFQKVPSPVCTALVKVKANSTI